MAHGALSRLFANGLAALLLAVGFGAVTAPRAVAIPSGQLAAWGAGDLGMLGDGTSTQSTAAVSVVSTGALAEKTIVQVDAGNLHACAVASDGLLACWGSNTYGQLGTGAAADEPAPRAISGGVLAGKQVVQVAAGAKHTCALTRDGLIACWGEGSAGALGGQPPASSAVPAPVFMDGILAGRTITQISAGDGFTCAVASGAVACWGVNSRGQLGDGTTTNRSIPVAASASGASALTGRTVTEVSAGLDHACARSSDESSACWGSNSVQQVFPSTTVKQVSVPTRVDQGALAGRRVSQVSAGGQFTCAVASGAVVCWGLNQVGQMANGPVSTTPQGIPALATTTAPSALAGKSASFVSAGVGHVCALTTDGSIACWGLGKLGQLGTGAPATGLTVPFLVTGNPGSGVMKGAIARGVATGYLFSVALTSSPPRSPTGLSASAGDAQATVSWLGPASTGGSPITSYVVQQSTDAGTTWSPAAGSPTAASATSLVVSGLPNGVNVTFRVAAVTVAGQGAFSGPTSVVQPTSTPAATPSAPAVSRPGAVVGLRHRNATARVVVLSWRPPISGAAPTFYQVRRKQGGHRFSAWTTVTASTLTIRKLRKGERYSFAVRAANSAGFGPAVIVRVRVR